MRSSGRVLILGARNAEQKIIAEPASILARVINEEVAKNKASFLTLD